VLDTERAKLFLDDVNAHGLAAYSYMTLPTDHTAGTKAGFYTPASYVASNDVALGQIVAALSKRPDWRDTVQWGNNGLTNTTGFKSLRTPIGYDLALQFTWSDSIKLVRPTDQSNGPLPLLEEPQR